MLSLFLILFILELRGINKIFSNFISFFFYSFFLGIFILFEIFFFRVIFIESQCEFLNFVFFLGVGVSLLTILIQVVFGFFYAFNFFNFKLKNFPFFLIFFILIFFFVCFVV